MTNLTLRNGTILSPVERFATALHIETGVITWMGNEDTATYRSRAYPDARMVDADGRLITSSFAEPLI